MEEFFYILQKVKNRRINFDKDKDNLKNVPDMFKKVCRLCLSENDNLQFASQIYKQKIKYSELVAGLLNIDIVEENEYFHSKICEDCASNLTLFYNYKQKCEANYETLVCLNQHMNAVTGKTVKVEAPEPVLDTEHLVVIDEELGTENEILVEESLDAILEDNDTTASDDAKSGTKVLVDGVTYELVEKTEAEDVDENEEEEALEVEELELQQEKIEPEEAAEDEEEIFENYEELDDSDLKVDMVDYDEDEPPEFLWSDQDEKSEADSSAQNESTSSKTAAQRVKNHVCKICGHHVDSPSKLERHMHTHAENYKGRRPATAGTSDPFLAAKSKRVRVNKYLCPICMALFESPNKLRPHLVFHEKQNLRATGKSTDEKFPCKYCQCEFPTAAYCRIHEEQHEKVREEKELKKNTKKEYTRNPILCHLCGKYFAKNRSEMTVHMRRHRGEKPYKCEFCEKSFAAGSGLRAHRRIHTGEKPYPCHYCGKLYGDYTSRVKHERRTHTGEKPYPCPHCEKAFVCPRVLKNHIMIHTGVKDHICNICGKGFIKAGNLKVHQNVHLREMGQPLAYMRPKKQKPEEEVVIEEVYEIKREEGDEEELEMEVVIMPN